mgnify:CR=1 FL=1
MWHGITILHQPMPIEPVGKIGISLVGKRRGNIFKVNIMFAKHWVSIPKSAHTTKTRPTLIPAPEIIKMPLDLLINSTA